MIFRVSVASLTEISPLRLPECSNFPQSRLPGPEISQDLERDASSDDDRGAGTKVVRTTGARVQFRLKRLRARAFLLPG